MSRRFGKCATVVNIDPKRVNGEWVVHVQGGRVPTELRALAWAIEVQRLGAGEIVLTSMDADGTKNGYDLEMLRAVCDGGDNPGRGQRRGGEPAAPGRRLRGRGRRRTGREHFSLRRVYYPRHEGLPRRPRRAGTPACCRGVTTHRLLPGDPQMSAPAKNAAPAKPAAPMIPPPPAEEVPMAAAAEAEKVPARPGDPTPPGGLKLAAAVPGEFPANQLFRTVMLHEASDLHLKSGHAGDAAAPRPDPEHGHQAAVARPTSKSSCARSCRRPSGTPSTRPAGPTSPTSSATTNVASASTSSSSAANSRWSPGGSTPASRPSRGLACRRRSRSYATTTRAWSSSPASPGRANRRRSRRCSTT